MPGQISATTDYKEVLEAIKPTFIFYQSVVAPGDTDPDKALESEVLIWVKRWQNTLSAKPKCAVSTLDDTDRQVFPFLHRMLTLLATLPVTTCTAERVFSKLKLTVDRLSNNMCQERVEGLLLMQLNRTSLPSSADTIKAWKNLLPSRRLKF